MRDIYDEIQQRGADVVAVGTGDRRYAQHFVVDERVPFLVLVDDDAAAANAASVKRASALSLAGPKSWAGSVAAARSGHRIHKSGKRVTQLGATFVLGPGQTIGYEHVDAHTSDHAPVAEVLAALDG